MASMLMTMMWQSPDAISSGNERLLMVFIGLIAVAMVVQAIVIGIAAMGAVKAQKKMMGVAEELRIVMVPFLNETRSVLSKTNDLISDVGPAIRTITAHVSVASENIAKASESLKDKAQEFDETLGEANQRARVQIRRVDSMVTSTLTATSEIAASIYQGIQVPVREVVGILAGLKAGLDSLMGRAREFGVFPGGKSRNRDMDL